MNIEKPLIIHAKSHIPLGFKIIEAFDSALEELIFIQNPSLDKKTRPSKKIIASFKKRLKIPEIWINFPWSKTVVHTVSENWYFKLRTSRNKDLITQEEQLNYRKATAGIAGLSVGSVVLSALVVSGGPKSIKIADPDLVEITNLNRMKAGLGDVNQNKTDVAAKEVWSVDPFADLHLWREGLTEANVEEFIVGKPKLGIFIDEMDNLYLKIFSRLICKESKIPVLMATDIGDCVIVDVERYDLEPTRPLFHGFVGKIDIADYKKVNHQAWLRLSTKIIGSKYLPLRLRQSLRKVGKTLPGVPQLGTTASVAGAAIAYIVRRIANRQSMPSGRYIVSLDQILSLKG